MIDAPDGHRRCQPHERPQGPRYHQRRWNSVDPANWWRCLTCKNLSRSWEQAAGHEC